MSDFLIRGSGDVLEMLEETAVLMAALFGISRAEAVARINCHWRARESLDDLVLHATAEHWARRIYYVDEFVAGHLRKVPVEPPPRDSPCWTVAG